MIHLYTYTLQLMTLTGAEVAVSIQEGWTFQATIRTKITSEVCAAPLIGSLWINVIDGRFLQSLSYTP